MRIACTRTLSELAGSDRRILLLTADLGFMVLEEFAEAHPERFFNVGVAEANMMGLATGLAACGYVPFVYSIATFASMRGYEQIRNGPVLHNLPVRILGVGGGFEYGHGGFTHHALEDLALARAQPVLTVIAPADGEQAVSALRATYDLPGPVYYRLGKREDCVLPGLGGRFRLGRVEYVREGSDVLMLTIGSISTEAVKAADLLARGGIRAHVGVVSSLRPAPVDDLTDLLRRFPVVFTVEEHYVEGGLGSLVSEIAAETASGARVVRCGVRTRPGSIFGGESALRAANGLLADGLCTTVTSSLKQGVR
jgi:transketolase